ncbi:hypothetical protein E3T43_01280 [Cryobacterium sp. Hh7]|uniref:phage tail tube protein n=1 Tax=Cryobacterium sp. Hh7 TaxID=1259159 RepID=UPI00106B5698|nr:hypothetical protein [Cryobacterium sp. Hh7]TFD61130.1 hypothetical protein E3T43_01280 [Cryobacterium sp. Hh7]
MADVAETQNGPSAIDQTGNLTIWAIAGRTISQSAPSIALIGGTSCFRVTYSFTTGGWVLTAPQEKPTDERLTALQIRESLGRITPTLADLGYVDSSDSGSAAVVLAAGGLFQFIERRNVPQTTLAVVAQKVRVINVNLGPQASGPTDGTGKFTYTQAAAMDSLGSLVAFVA